MTEITDEVEAAIRSLNLGAAIRRLPAEEESPVRDKLLSTFVDRSDRRWWWEGFTRPSASIQFQDDQGFKRLPSLAPAPTEPCWLVVEDAEGPVYPIYEITPELATQIIGECFGFEYYLVAMDLSWLICENHHGRVIGIGPEVVAKIEAAAA